MNRFAILGEGAEEEKSKDKKTSNPKAVKAAVPAAVAPVEAVAAQKPSKKEGGVKKPDAPTGGGAGDKEEKDYKKDNSKRDSRRNDKKKDPEATGDRTKKDPKRKENKDKPGDPEGRAKIIAIKAEKEPSAPGVVSDAASDAASENNNDEVEVIVVPAEPPKKTFADHEREIEEARASLLQPKEGRKADTVKGTVIVNDETKDATARFYNAGAGAKDTAAKGEKKAKKVFEDVQFGTGDKGTPRPREFTVFTPSTQRSGARDDRKGKPNANDFGPSLSASLGKK